MTRKGAGCMTDLSNARQPPPLVLNSAVRLLPPASRFTLRGARPVMEAAGAALGLNISDIACRSAGNGRCAALWLAPDEQLVLAPVADGDRVARQLRDALCALPHSVVDVSHRQIAVEICGPPAQAVLNAGCPLDLHICSFPIGMSTRTVLGKADIVLWRTSAAAFHVEVWRSFADYALRFLTEASRELVPNFAETSQ
jgi:sarcosine oxidase, subunit gamma